MMFAELEAPQLKSTECCTNCERAVTPALALLVGSALLVAFTDTLVVTPTPRAVNSPPGVTVPFVADQVTPWFVVPDTVAVNCWLAPGLRVTAEGLIVSEIGEAPGGIGG